jgi:hypothetical protein
MGGACFNSGSIDTGQVLFTQGGQKLGAWIQSGLGVDTVIQSGPGRLDTILLTTYLQSGRGAIFYDSAVATSGGPFSASGHLIVGILPPAVNVGIGIISGTTTGIVPWTGEPYRPQMPFFSGLVAAPWPAAGTASGTHGFSVSYTIQTIVSGNPTGQP